MPDARRLPLPPAWGGYRVAPEGALDPALSAVLRAFQRHWRQEAITGQADDGTLVRLQAVARLMGVPTD